MERLTEGRTDKLNHLRLVERERNALEKEKREVENYLRLQNDYVCAQSTLYQFYIRTKTLGMMLSAPFKIMQQR
jgi:structural maintenance of chromosome 4